MEHLSYEQLYTNYCQLQQQLNHYRQYDQLTGIYNKNTFYDKVEQLHQEQTPPFALVCIDVERFKVINNLFGTQSGNTLLQYLAQALQATAFPAPHLVARLAADIFAVCLLQPLSDEEVEQAVLAVFQKAPLPMDVVPAIGIYHVAPGPMPAVQMCDRAILALNSIKGNYAHHCAVYGQGLWDTMMQEQEMVHRARTALAEGEFQLYLQPKCNMRTGKVVGAEALARWEHPQQGMIPPDQFIPVFERNGFIKSLDAYLWEEAAKWQRSWLNTGRPLLPISVNVSRVDIVTMDVFQVLKQLREKYQLPPTALEIEITESAYTSNFHEIVYTVEKLMHAGCVVLMDDFGSGYSSLNMLKDININVLKLDLRFLDSTNRKSKDIIESIVHMAKWLNLQVIAEGVESKKQVDFLLEIGCEYAQGFYYYRPMDVYHFETLLSTLHKADFHDRAGMGERKNSLIKFKDLFHADMMSEQLLNNIVGGIALYQYDGKTLTLSRCNSEYYRITSMEEQSGSTDLLPLVEKEDLPSLCQALEQAKRTGDLGTETTLRRRCLDGTLLWLQLRLFHLSETNGKSIYYAGIADVTAQRDALEELRMSERRFRIAMEASRSTLFEVDIATRVASFARHSQEEFGLVDCVANAPEGFIEQGSVCEDYVETFRELYSSIYRGEDQSSCVIQAHMGDGSIVWNRITLIAVKNKAGETVKAVGLVENVSKEIELERQLKALTPDTSCHSDHT